MDRENRIRFFSAY